ncbi:MAG TPA: glycosyltransferase family 39 protein [Thermoanaerobaculia bacterium]|jgi:hypothetical protein|nr:glycosyltransferase family 39 protein [Thermoanaerobaculia bacterium]
MLVTVFFVVTTAVWVNLDTVPPLWDQSQYLQESEILYHTLRHSGPVAFLSAFSGVMGMKAPLITALPLPFYFLLGESHLAARYVNVVFILIASWYLFRLGELVAGRRAALLGVIILNTFPLVAGMARQVLVEYGLMTLVILWMYYLLRWQGGEEKSSAWALGIVLGLGMLLKVTFPLYVGVPTALVLLRDVLRHRRLRASTLASLARVAVVAVPLAGIWYFKNWAAVFGFVMKAGYGDWAQAYSKGSVFSMGTVGTYWLDLINFGIGGYWFLVLVIVTCWIAVKALRREGPFGIARDHLYPLLAWWTVPWLALTFTVSKDIRFSVPYLPAIALLLGSGCAAIARRRWGTAGLGLIAVLGILHYTYYSFVARNAGLEWRAGPLIVSSNNLKWAHPPTAEPWPNEDVAKILADDAQKQGFAQSKAAVLFSHPRLSSHNLNYLSALHEFPVRFTTCNIQMTESSSELASRVRTESNYLLTKSASLGPEFLNVKNVEVLDLLQGAGLPFDRIASIALPDQSELFLFRRNERGYRVWRPEDYFRLHAPGQGRVVRFGSGISLVNSDVADTSHGLKLSLVWQCTAQMKEDYRVYVHAYAPDGQVFANGDHYPAHGNHPTSRWRVGEVIEEQVWIPKAPPAGLRIYVGWYQFERRFQLPVEGGGAREAEPNGVRIY